MSSGDVFRALSTGVSSGKTPHTSHAVFLPRPRKYDTVSQPVSAWNNGIAADLAGPKDSATGCTGILQISIAVLARYVKPRKQRTILPQDLDLGFVL